MSNIYIIIFCDQVTCLVKLKLFSSGVFKNKLLFRRFYFTAKFCHNSIESKLKCKNVFLFDLLLFLLLYTFFEYNESVHMSKNLYDLTFILYSYPFLLFKVF